MEDFDDIDSLIDFEEELQDEPNTRKRCAIDVHSQQEALANLDGAVKRPRTAHAFPSQAVDIDDDRLLELVGNMPASQSHQQAPLGSLPPEDEEILRLAALSQPQPFDSLPDTQPGIASCHRQPTNADSANMDVDAELDALLALGEELQREHGSGADAANEDQQQQNAPAADEAPAPTNARNQTLDSMLPARVDAPPLRDAINVRGQFLTVTSSNGDRVYAPVMANDSSIARGGKVDIAGALRRVRGGLLSSHIDELMAAVEREQFERALVETAAENAATKAAQSTEAGATVDEQPAAASTAATKRRKTKKSSSAATSSKASTSKALPPSASSSLWVDKYAPRSFLDLLSDEQVNRDVVRWLKSWDPCVFNRPAPEPPCSATATGGRGKRHHQGGRGRAFREGAWTPGKPPPAEDPLGRPEHKAILLCGPPGLGKTTLAHVVAQHCGYRPVEINASDDRSGNALLARVVDAVEMRSVIAGDKRPNCLIIDEIDGVAGGGEGRSAISALLKVITAAAGRSGGGKGAGGGSREDGTKGNKGRRGDNGGDDAREGEDDGSESEGEGEGNAGNGGGGGGANNSSSRLTMAGGKRGGNKRRLRPLMRPIICICNDLYAPALRPLRDVVRVFQFRRPSAERLANRLASVCAAEGLRAEKSTLRMLADRAECDVRSCLNTLQFLAKRQREVRHADLAKLGLGQKDQTKGAFQVWGELFQRKKASSVFGGVAENENQRASRLFSTLLDYGETELVVNGFHETLPGLRFFDMGMSRTSQVFTHLQDADVLLRASRRGSSSMVLMRYLPAPAVHASLLVAGHERPAVAWPRSAAEARRRNLFNQGILHQWTMGMSPSTYAALGPAAATQELLPMMPYLTAPALRPVSRHLFTASEQATVDALVDTMLRLGLRYSMDAEDDGDGEGVEDDVLFSAARAAGTNPIGSSRYMGGGGRNGGGHGGGGTAVAAGFGNRSSCEPPIQFRPQIHRLWSFKGSITLQHAPSRRSLPFATRQTLLHEIEMEGIRRMDASRSRNAAGHAADTSTLEKHPLGRCAQNANGDEKGLLHQNRHASNNGHQQPGSMPPPSSSHHVPLDLAERLRKNGVAGRGTNVAPPEGKRKCNWLDSLRDKRHAQRSGNGTMDGKGGNSLARSLPVLYKYHEGYTNAVKRPVLMAELL